MGGSSRATTLLAWISILGLAVAGCTGPGASRTVLPALAPEDVDPAAGFEPLPVLRAADLLPAALREGLHHRVQDEVRSDGFLHLYTIESRFGVFEAAGDDLLHVRVREIEALAELDAMSKRREFAKALAAGLKSPFVATWNLIRDPVDSIIGIPNSAWETVKRTATLTRRERGEFEDSGFREFLGFEAKKRELAFQLGVDPYTSNGELQKQLNRFAWAAYIGDLPFMLVPFQGDPVAEAPSGSHAGDRLRNILRHYAPEDLRRLNRIELAVMGVEETLADAFLQHAWFSPRHSTILVESLVALDLTEDRASFIRTALQAGSEADALFYQSAARLLRAYHEEGEPIRKLSGNRRAVLGETMEGNLVIPLVVDHAVWSRPTAEFARRMADSGSSVARTELLISGTLSERARREMEALGLQVRERAFRETGPEVSAETQP